jgi:hypothetical protein
MSRRHALALHPLTREKAQAAARALWDRRRYDALPDTCEGRK